MVAVVVITVFQFNNTSTYVLVLDIATFAVGLVARVVRRRFGLSKKKKKSGP